MEIANVGYFFKKFCFKRKEREIELGGDNMGLK